MREERTANHLALFSCTLLNQQPLPCQLDCHLISRKNQLEKYNKTILSTVGKCRVVIRSLQSRDVTFWVHESCWHRAVSPPAVQEQAWTWLQHNTVISPA